MYKVFTKYVDPEIPQIDHSLVTWEKHVVLNDWRIVQKDQKQTKATCIRGENYLLFHLISK